MGLLLNPERLITCPVLYVLSGNSRSYQQWMHTVKVFTVHAVSTSIPFPVLLFLYILFPSYT